MDGSLQVVWANSNRRVLRSVVVKTGDLIRVFPRVPKVLNLIHSKKLCMPAVDINRKIVRSRIKVKSQDDVKQSDHFNKKHRGRSKKQITLDVS